MAKKKNSSKYVAKNPQYVADTLTANRNYKDTVFRLLFSDKENLLSLYNAISGSVHTDVQELEIITLENAIYMGIKNDLAFIIDLNLFLYEHQSTYNPNMPLRDLFYISNEYQKLVDRGSLYSSTLQMLPAPNFIVFYNGTEHKEDSWTDYLSASYQDHQQAPNLELKVVTLNINEGYNMELMKQCQILKEYASYVAKVRKYKKTMNLTAAVEHAVDECIQAGILEDFLRSRRSEVIAVSIFEYNKEEEERKLRKAEFEAGVERGIEQGRAIEREQRMDIEIQNLIKFARKNGISYEKLQQSLLDDYKLTAEKAAYFIEKYWK